MKSSLTVLKGDPKGWVKPKCKYISTSDQTNKAADFTDDYDVDDDDVWLPLIEFKIEDKIELRNSANSSLPTMTMMMMM